MPIDKITNTVAKEIRYFLEIPLLFFLSFQINAVFDQLGEVWRQSFD